MQETFSLWGLTGYGYGLWIAGGAALMLAMMGVIGYRYRMPIGTVRVFGALAIPLGLVCARLVFCLLNLEKFTETYENPLLILRFFDGGLSMTGLLIGLLLTALITARIMKVRAGKMMDVLAVPLGLFIAACRIAERFTTLGVGKVVEENAVTKALPWLFLTETAGVATEYRMAVYRYEAIVALLIFLFIFCLFLAFRKQKNVMPGDLALLFFSLYGASQVLLESLRDDGHLLITFLRIAQVAAALMPVIATAIFTRRYLRIRGKADSRIVLSWLVLLLCIGVAILLEFSLDGRFSWGNPSMLRDYLILSVVAILLFAIPYGLFQSLHRKIYAQGHILVHVSADNTPRR